MSRTRPSFFFLQAGRRSTFLLSLALGGCIAAGIFLGLRWDRGPFRLLAHGRVLATWCPFGVELSRECGCCVPMTTHSTIRPEMLARAHHVALYQQSTRKDTAFQTGEAAGALALSTPDRTEWLRGLKSCQWLFTLSDRRKTPMFVSFSAVALNLLLNCFSRGNWTGAHRDLRCPPRVSRLPTPLSVFPSPECASS